jgi:pimeloyl-ACP methyl ester carboxylesterase
MFSTTNHQARGAAWRVHLLGGDHRRVRIASSDGVELALHDLGGPPDASPLLLSHATGFHAYVLAPLAEHLASRFHCWGLDYRGHGHSADSPTDIGDWSRFGADASAAARALGLEGAIGFGHSMGGTALLMAELARPGTFAGLVLFEPITFPRDPSRPDRSEPGAEAVMVAAARRRRTAFANREEAYENYASKRPLAVLTPEALWAYVEHGFVDRPDGSVELRCDPEHEARIFEGGARQETFEHLGEVTCPVLVVAGAPEENPPGLIAPVIADALPRGRFTGLTALTHFGPMQDPAAVAALVLAFADELGVPD